MVRSYGEDLVPIFIYLLLFFLSICVCNYFKLMEIEKFCYMFVIFIRSDEKTEGGLFCYLAWKRILNATFKKDEM